MAGKLVLCRHGQSEWNLENKFTGWEDVELTPLGEEEALEAGRQLKAIDINFDIAFTSLLKRANKTLFSILEQMDLTWIPITHAWELNERHYGALQGKNKAEVAKEFGDEQVHIWRRSYDIPPPSIDNEDPSHPRFDSKYDGIDELPSGESLKDTLSRVKPYWENQILPELLGNKNVLVVAHGNSLRSMIKIIEKIDDESIVGLNLPTGIPIVYEFNENLEPVSKDFLADSKSLQAAQDAVANQGKSE
tara:strand:- start:320 stop:1063 length:744 start_codon:yes stop_codon:yes gene_type:complete